MRKVYLDNAATTAIRSEVITAMTEVMENQYGNPSSTHSFGRSARMLVETSRKKIAGLLHCQAQEIVFTSGGTEADNWILRGAVSKLGIERIITTRTEHHAVLHVVQELESMGTEVCYLAVEKQGIISYEELEDLLKVSKRTLVSLMHVNNETGTIFDLLTIGQLCRASGAYFHSDTVQSIGKQEFVLNELPIDFLTASAHKFHGPKGIGFAYVRKNIPMPSFILGGEQEKGWRAGTEAVHQIVGMAKALELSYQNLKEERASIFALKEYAVEKLKNALPGIKINGNREGFYTILNVLLPLPKEKTGMIVFFLDMKGIAVSRGSACQSGSTKPSHVLQQMLSGELLELPSIRISFSHWNTREEIDYLVEVLQTI